MQASALLSYLSCVLAALTTFYVGEAEALSCRVCAEPNLDEFGECAHSFDYDCGDYAARRAIADQRVYCRTTRQRARNGTYTIVKECIAEAAHYADFPRAKSARLDEECDVADLAGVEAAYCLCRTGDYCNAAPIADQFSEFENKYPEFFEPVDTNAGPDPADLGGGDRRNFPAPTRQSNLDDLLSGNSGTASPSLSGADAVIQRPAPIAPVPAFGPTQPQPIVPVGAGSGGLALSANTFANASPHQIPAPFTGSTSRSPVSSSAGGASSAATLSCLQCSEANLANESADCAAQIAVDCPASQTATLGRPLCFSRQILTPKGEFGVEKMCVPEKAVLEEFGDDAVLDGCATIDAAAVVSRYCVCSTPNCNRASVIQQMSFDKGVTASTSNRNTFTATKATAPTPPGTRTSPAAATAESAPTALRCVTCLDAELRSPLADCKRASQQQCRAAPGERAYCLTRQTQNGKDSFIVEKSCTTRAAFLENFPEERKFVDGGGAPMASRCASTYDGYVNFCICDSELCNRGALTQQAEQFRALGPVPAGLLEGSTEESNSAVFPAFPDQERRPAPTPSSATPTRITPAATAATPPDNRRYGAATQHGFGGDHDDTDSENDAPRTSPRPPMGSTASTGGKSADSERLARWRESLDRATGSATGATCAPLVVIAVAALATLTVLGHAKHFAL